MQALRPVRGPLIRGKRPSLRPTPRLRRRLQVARRYAEAWDAVGGEARVWLDRPGAVRGRRPRPRAHMGSITPNAPRCAATGRRVDVPAPVGHRRRRRPRCARPPQSMPRTRRPVGLCLHSLSPPVRGVHPDGVRGARAVFRLRVRARAPPARSSRPRPAAPRPLQRRHPRRWRPAGTARGAGRAAARGPAVVRDRPQPETAPARQVWLPDSRAASNGCRFSPSHRVLPGAAAACCPRGRRTGCGSTSRSTTGRCSASCRCSWSAPSYWRATAVFSPGARAPWSFRTSRGPCGWCGGHGACRCCRCCPWSAARAPAARACTALTNTSKASASRRPVRR